MHKVGMKYNNSKNSCWSEPTEFECKKLHPSGWVQINDLRLKKQNKIAEEIPYRNSNACTSSLDVYYCLNTVLKRSYHPLYTQLITTLHRRKPSADTIAPGGPLCRSRNHVLSVVVPSLWNSLLLCNRQKPYLVSFWCLLKTFLIQQDF